MKHTDHPDWDISSPTEKQRIRRENYKKLELETEIEDIERLISEYKKDDKSTLLLEGILKRKQYALDNNPFYEPDENTTFIEDFNNIGLDYINNSKL